MNRNFGMSGRQRLGGMSAPPSAFDANTRVDLNSYLLPSESILHCENVPDPSFNVPAFGFVAIFLSAVGIALAVLFSFLRAVGL
jgi:hypothetical protein